MKIKQNISVFKIICKQSAAIAILLVGILFTAVMPLFVAAAPGDLDPTFGGGKVLTQIGSSYDYANAVAVQADGKIVVAGTHYFNATEGERCVLVRYNADGTLDTTFGTNGRVTQNYQNSDSEEFRAVVIQPDGKIVVTGFYNAGTNYNFITARFNSNGQPDSTFNGNGSKAHDVSGAGRNDGAFAVTLQSDGRIVVVGYSNNATTANDFAFVRYNSDGSPDTSFSGDGIFTTNYTLGNTNDEARAVAIQSDGKIVATGININSNLGVIRLNSDGTVHSSFSGGGANEADGNAIAIQPDGKIVVGGYEYGTGFSNFALARYNPDGTGDSSFDTDARLTTIFASGNSSVKGISIQPDGKIVAAGFALDGSYENFALARYNANGSLDASFDGDGKQVSKLDINHSHAFGIALQSDGKIIAAGRAETISNYDIAVARYNANGSLDGTFNPGKVTTKIGTNDDDGYGVALQSDGKIVVAGAYYNGSNYDFAVVRYNADGSLDTTFSSDGKVTTTIGSGDEKAEAVTIQPDGKIIAAGYYINGTAGDSALVRYNVDGTLDSSFGSGGRVTTQTSTSTEGIYALAIQSDGRILATGRATNGTGTDFVITRYNPNGTLDSAFDGDGIKFYAFFSNVNDSAQSIAIESDGRIVLAGSTYNGSSYEFALLRLDSNGALQASTTTNVGAANSADEAFAIAIQPDGKIIAAGFSDGNFAVVRYNANFSLDSNFDSDGKVITNFGVSSTAYGVVLQSDGKILVGGVVNSNPNNDFALARYNPNGSLDTTFSGDGKQITDINGGQDNGRGIALQSDGKIVLAGFSSNGTNNDFAIARYLGGSLNCSYTLTPTSQSVIQAGANHTFNVTTDTGCEWTATTSDGWISITGGTPGNGNGTVSYTVAANPNNTPLTGTISAGGQTFTVTQAATALNVSIPTGLTSLKNTTLTVPVNVGNTTGTGIIAYDFTITYDPAVLIPMATPFDKTGTLSSGFEVNVNSGTPGTLVVSGFGSTPLSGMGTLLNLKFEMVGNAPSCGALNFTIFRFNEGNPAAATTNGQACVISGAVSGRVTYATAAQQTFVPGVAVSAAGSVNLSAATAADGTYTLSGFGSGAYTVTPSKTGDVNNAVSALDASLVAQHVIGLTTLNANQMASADVSGNGTITSFDAGLIAQYAVGLPNPGNAGTWKFTPVNRVYPLVVTDQLNQDYSAVLMGDVTGNWTAPQPDPFAFIGETSALKLDDGNSVEVGLGKSKTNENGELIVPVLVSDLSGKGVYSFEFELEYDPKALRLEQTTDKARLLEVSETLSGNFSFAVNPLEKGKVRVSGYGVSALEGEGVLLNLKFKSAAKQSVRSELKWQNFRFNEGGQKIRLKDGTVIIKKGSEPISKTRHGVSDEMQEN